MKTKLEKNDLHGSRIEEKLTANELEEMVEIFQVLLKWEREEEKGNLKATEETC